MFLERTAVRRARGLVTTAVVAATVMWLTSAGTAYAAPARQPAKPPATSPGPAVRQVTPLRTTFPAQHDDPAKHNFRPTAVTWPSAGTEAIALPSAQRNTPAGSAHAKRLPLWLRTADGARPATTVDLRVFGPDQAAAAGVSGVLFSVAPQGNPASGLTVGLDYAAFAEAYGGNYGARLRLVQMPSCVLTTPSDPACRTAQPVRSVNDTAKRTVSAALPTASVAQSGSVAQTASVVFAATASDPGTEGGAGGTYAATDLKPSGSWTAGGSTGSFDYTYPLTLPPAASTLVPKVALAYDSGSIDGQTASTQAQSSWIGDGWSTPSSFVEQSFAPCADNPEGSASPTSTQDQCYDGQILTLSLNGTSTSLVYDSGTWRPQNEDGSAVTRVMNSGNGSGTHDTDYWKVVTRDGTTYYFGRNQLPGWQSGKATTNSVDSSPVFSAHSGDPCYNATWSQSWCTMAYRWNLDYVVDVHGNAEAYYYKQDTNFYGRNKGATMTSYVRNSYLDHIDYGFTDGSAYGTPPDRIQFTTGDRCLSGTCQPLNATNKANWPDVPFDLICASGATCGSWSPAFFSTVRLTSIVTQQWSTASSQYIPVDTYALTQTIPPTGDGTSPTLWLSSITRTGQDTTAGAGSSLAMPTIQFGSVQLQNRVDTVTDGLPAFYKYRIQTITTEAGSAVTVTYSLPNPCTAPVSISPATNTSSCYPVSWTPPGYTDPITDWFHKYAVTKVTSTDPTGGAPALSTSYTYLGGAAWHFDDNEIVKAKYRTYGQFRGYGKVQTRNGDGVNDRQTLEENSFYRGMSKNNTTTVVNVTDSQGGAHEDVNELSGKTLETVSYLGDGGPADHSTITSYWVSNARATRTRSGLNALTSTMVAPVETFSRQAVTSSGTTTWRYTETDSSYDSSTTSPTFGLLKATYLHTVPAAAEHDRCTLNTYAPVNSAKNLVGLMAETETDSVACGGFTAGTPASVPGSVNTLSAPAGVSRPAQVVSDTRTFYDDATWSTAFPQTSVDKGDATMARKASTYSGGSFQYLTTSRSKYDSVGRVTDAYDGNGNHTVTGYTANSAGLITGKSITNPLGQVTNSSLDTLRGITLTATDINGVVTTERYDALGRLTAVWLNNRTTAQPANYVYAYQVTNTGVTATTTKKLNDSSGYQTSTVIFDGLLRQRQTQTVTPQGGRLVTDTFYDSRGWVSSKNNGWWDPATTPNTTPVAPSGVNPPPSLPTQNRYTYDGLGRTVLDVSEKDNQAVSTTTTVYNGDRTTVVPPAGGLVSTTVVDAQGRTTERDVYSTRPAVTVPADTFTGIFSLSGGTAVALTYGFDSHGNQATVTEAGPHTWTSTFDNLLGQVTSKSEPDSGTTTGMQYDGNGNVVQYTSARGKTISYTYDALNRKTGEYAAAVTAQSPGNQLAQWVFDNSDNAVPGMSYARGQMTSSTAYWNGSAYKTQQTAFTIFGESTGSTITIPAAEGALAGTYTFSQIYTSTTGLPLKDIYPAKNGLPAETVLHGYTGVLDKPNTLGGLTGYAQGTSYDAYGRILQSTIGAGTNLAYVTNTWDPHTGWLKDQLITRSATTPSSVDDQAYSYDFSGNVTAQTETRLGSSTSVETQCFQYDALVQLTQAWTATDACAATPAAGASGMVGDGLGSASAYWTTWVADPLGWRTVTQHSTTGGTDTVTTYGYDGNGAHQTHTLKSTSSTGGSTGSTSYTYNAAGNMATRNAGQGSQSLAWDDADRLTAITGSTSGDSTFLYDADGGLLLQKDPGLTTLYLGTEQFTLATGTGTVSGTRYYALPGGGKAIRTGTATSAYAFAVSDQHGTPTLYLDNTAQVPTWRQTTPYGAPRGTAVTAPDNHAFLDKPQSDATGLTVVGARSYDPKVGRFISVDPVFDPNDALQIGGYAYGGNNPVSHTDPTGKRYDPDIDGRFWVNTAGEAEYKPNWPPNDGADGDSYRYRHQRGEQLDRYGKPSGKYMSPADTPKPQRAMPPEELYDSGALRRYEVIADDLESTAAKVAPAFHQPGGGTQYKMDERVEDLVKDEKLRPMTDIEPYKPTSTDLVPRNNFAGDAARTGAAEVAEAGAGEAAAADAGFIRAGTAVKAAGGVLMVAAVAIDIYDVATAPPGQKLRTAVRDATSLAVGCAFGAAGAAVAGPVGAIVLGYVGSVVGAKLGDAISNLFHW